MEAKMIQGLFSHILQVLPRDKFPIEYDVISSFRATIHNFLLGAELNLEQFQKVRLVLVSIREQLDAETTARKILDAVLDDFQYPVDPTELRSVLVHLAVAEAFTFYDATSRKAEECPKCHCPYQTRHRIQSRTFYTCVLCGAAILKHPPKDWPNFRSMHDGLFLLIE